MSEDGGVKGGGGVGLGEGRPVSSGGEEMGEERGGSFGSGDGAHGGGGGGDGVIPLTAEVGEVGEGMHQAPFVLAGGVTASASRLGEELEALQARLRASAARGGGGVRGLSVGDLDEEGKLVEEEEEEAREVTLGEVVDLGACGEEVEYIGTTGLKVTQLGDLGVLEGRCKALTVRSNALVSIAEVSGLHLLEYLEVYDNLVEDVSAAGRCERLEVLDASYNAIRSLEGLERLSRLSKLYVASNKLGDLSPCVEHERLELLDAGTNRIREIPDGMERLAGLRELWLGKNKITCIRGLGELRGLRKLDLQSNRLTRVEGLEGLEALEELYLGHNAIETLHPGVFSSLTSLHTLDLSSNRLSALLPAHLLGLRALKDLWLSANAIAAFDDVIPALQEATPELQTLYLEHNPLARAFDYRIRLARRIPTLTQIDATAVPRE